LHQPPSLPSLSPGVLEKGVGARSLYAMNCASALRACWRFRMTASSMWKVCRLTHRADTARTSTPLRVSPRWIAPESRQTER
jgi:hypothetical protein